MPCSATCDADTASLRGVGDFGQARRAAFANGFEDRDNELNNKPGVTGPDVEQPDCLISSFASK
jgi:hypothetical protein